MSKKTKTLLENTIYINLKSGRVVIELYPEIAPLHVDRIKKLVRSKFYNGASWHRVVDNLFAQCCKRNENTTQIKNSTLPAEISNLPHIRGTVSMARMEDIDSATNQFFITTSEARFLDQKYTVFGFVREGIELIDDLKKGDRTNKDLVIEPDIVISMSVAIDEETKKLLSKNRNKFRLGAKSTKPV
ncbi:MAG: peptidylprolyl isomerase [Alphaproteobacteria bacterium]|nr:peptidylprolyl isomerase [Rickettsiales bacterium]